MMNQFKISAPGKFSLFGEQTARYGKRAMTASVNLRTTMTFIESLSSPSSVIVLTFPQIELYLQVPLQIFLEFYNNTVQDISSLHQQVLRFTDYTYPTNHQTHKKLVQMFYYLLILIVHKELIDLKPFTMHFDTDFLVDKDFVFLPSYTVCVSAGLNHWSSVQKGCPHISLIDKNLEKIQLYAACCDEISQESGIVEVTPCTYGAILEYQTGNSPQVRPLLYISTLPRITVLLVDSKQSQSLENQTYHISQLINMLPETSVSVFDSIDGISKRAYNVFDQIRAVYQDEKNDVSWKKTCIIKQYQNIKHFILTNQNLLRALNVSHDCLDEICNKAQSHGMCGKYTDICDGRFAYIFCPRHVNDDCTHMTLLENELKELGYSVTKTRLARHGVKFEPLIIEF